MTGLGQATATPDLFAARFAAQASRLRPAEAMDAASAALTRMREAAVRHGVPDGGISTSSVSLRQDYDQQGQPHGFVAEIGLTVRLGQVADAGNLLSDCIGAGGEQARLDGTSFEHADPAAPVVAAREAAYGDAVARAQQLASLAGRQLGPVIWIEESAPGFARMAKRTSLEVALPSSAVPMDPGSLGVSVTLTVAWAWA